MFQPVVKLLPAKASLPGFVARLFSRMAELPRAIALDSSAHPATSEGIPLGRYSFFAADPIRWWEVNEAKSDAFDKMRGQLTQPATAAVGGLGPFQGGWGGLLSYDFHRCLECIPHPRVDPFRLPLGAWGLYDVVAVVDHESDTVHLISQGFAPGADHHDEAARQRRATERMDYFLQWLDDAGLLAATPPIDTPGSANQKGVASGATRDPLEDDPVFDQLSPRLHPLEDLPGMFSCFDREQYLEMVRRAIEYIRAGDVFQVNLAQQLYTRATVDSSALYAQLRAANPAPFGGYLDLGNAQVISSSPERLIQVDGRHVETRPIKGTRPRTRRPEVDLNVAAELMASAKDRAENIMIVDLMRNDLSRVCSDDSVVVPQLCGLEAYQNVFHLVSAVRGCLAEGLSAIDVLGAVFPGGSITGAPKVRAMQIIQELEPLARGAYCGSLGYLSTTGHADFNILIRTITASRGWWQIPVGGGIVARSDPQREYDETWTKASAMLRAVHFFQDVPQRSPQRATTAAAGAGQRPAKDVHASEHQKP